jgi:hypothetical protein
VGNESVNKLSEGVASVSAVGQFDGGWHPGLPSPVPLSTTYLRTFFSPHRKKLVLLLLLKVDGIFLMGRIFSREILRRVL